MVAFVSDDVTRVLVQRTIVGDRVALATLFEHCHLRVFRSAFLVVRNREVADDIVQLVFLELFRALPSFDTHRPFLPWLYRIVHHVTVDYLRREVYRRPTLPLRETTPDPTDVAERIEESALLGPVLDALSMEHREALMLRYFVGLSRAGDGYRAPDSSGHREIPPLSRLERGESGAGSGNHAYAGERGSV